MAARSTEDLLDYYKRELAYLRGRGAEFARSYPKVAHLLELEGGASTDPHVERLIEAFAFLSARVHCDLDNEFPHIATALLESLYPNLVSPVPSMSVANFSLDPEKGKITSGLQVPRHTQLLARADNGLECRFRTCYPVTLWPIEIEDAGFAPADAYAFLRDNVQIASVLRLRLACAGDTDFGELELDRLRLHLHGDWMEVMPIYDLLVSSVREVIVQPDGGAPVRLPKEALVEVGFEADEEVLPCPGHVYPAYRLLQEYFAFPRKFLFFDVLHLERARGPHRGVELLFPLDQPRLRGHTIDRNSFRLGCTPIINLFRKTTEPLRIDHRRFEYRLVPDWRSEQSTEIHSILGVSATDQESARSRSVAPFYSFDHAVAEPDGAYWWARRDYSLRPEVPGTEMWLSFFDLGFDPQRPDAPVVFASALCTNRRLAEQVPAGATLFPEGAAAAVRATSLQAPTAQLEPPLGGRLQWRLVSHLNLNQTSLLDPQLGLRSLRELLALYNPDESTRAHKQIMGIRSMACRSVVGRVGRDAWRGFCGGYEITLEFDEDGYVGGSSLLMAAVLSRFFALYTAVNSFTRTVVMRGNEVRKRWQPNRGMQPVL